MSNMNGTLPPELDAAITEYYATLEPSSSFAARLEQELRQRQGVLLQHKTKPRSHFSWSDKRKIVQTLRARPILTLIVVLIVLSLLTGVAYAIGRLTGFVPGFGFTSDIQSVFLLSKPVEIITKDVTLRVDKAVGDESKFWVNLTVLGLSGEQDFIQAFVSLPNGEKIPMQMSSSTTVDSNGVNLTYIFPPLPTATSDLILFIENLGGKNFRVPIKLRLAKPGEILPSEPKQSEQLRSKTYDGVTLVLDHISPASDKTVFQVSLHFDKPGMSLNSDWNVILTDQNGAIYPAVDITPVMMDGNTKIFQTLPFSGNEQLTVSLNVFPNAKELPVSIDFSIYDAKGFLFDPGTEPVVGQTWTLDEVIQAGGFFLRAVSAYLASPTELRFEFESAENLTGVMLYTPDPLLRSADGGIPQANGKISAGLIFEEIPSQPFEVKVMRIYYTAHGSWEIKWKPPAAPQGNINQPAPSSAPTKEAYTTPTLASTNPILLEVQRLAQQFDAPFQEGPAWIHVMTEKKSNPQSGQTFPPPYLISEQWLETDSNGYVIRSVWIDKDEHGNTIQLSATVGDYSVNFTSGDAGFNDGKPYRFSADRFSGDLERAEQFDVSVTREETTCDNGQPCIVITSVESFSQPTLLAGETQAFIGSGIKGWINLTTGQQIQLQKFLRLEDGTNRVEYTERYLLVEKVSLPPQEILDILAKVIVP